MKLQLLRSGLQTSNSSRRVASSVTAAGDRRSPILYSTPALSTGTIRTASPLLWAASARGLRHVNLPFRPLTLLSIIRQSSSTVKHEQKASATSRGNLVIAHQSSRSASVTPPTDLVLRPPGPLRLAPVLDRIPSEKVFGGQHLGLNPSLRRWI